MGASGSTLVELTHTHTQYNNQHEWSMGTSLSYNDSLLVKQSKDTTTAFDMFYIPGLTLFIQLHNNYLI